MSETDRGIESNDEWRDEDAEESVQPKRLSGDDPEISETDTARLDEEYVAARERHEEAMAKSRVKEARAVSRANFARTAKWPVLIGAVLLAANYIFGGGDDNNNTASPPSADMPSPEVAIGSLGPASDLRIATGEVEGVHNATIRISQCTPINIGLPCIDYRLGTDIATNVDSGFQYVINGDQYSFGVEYDTENKPYVRATIAQDDIPIELVNPTITHPVADQQWLADQLASFNVDTLLPAALGRATQDAQSDVEAKVNKVVMDAGNRPGDAVAGAFVEAARAEIGRLADLVEPTAPEAAQVVRDMISPDRPMAVDFEADGFKLTGREPGKEIHTESWGLNFDLDFGAAAEATLSSDVSKQLARWSMDPKVIVIEYPAPTPR